MSDSVPPPEMEIAPRRRSPLRNLSAIWLVPILALGVALWVAWSSYSDRGALIEITFGNAAGITAGETAVRYRDVRIGVVESVGFTSGLDTVVVGARIDKDVAPYINDTAQFWVVRPEVSAQGVSGLQTVLSGVYIEGTWDRTKPGDEVSRFEGVEDRPLVDLNERGTRVTLQAKEGNVLAAGAPIFYRGIEVGRTEKPRLENNGTLVVVDAFIKAPHDQLLTTASRFWDTSGFQVSFGPSGLKLDVSSFSALIGGGIAFNTFFSGGSPIESGQVYELYTDEEAARANAYARVSDNSVTLATVFEDGVSGLAAGAALNYKGLKIGEVATLSAFVTEINGRPEVHQMVTLDVDPALMGLPEGAELRDVLNFLDSAVQEGVRARLSKASLLTSALVIELVVIEDAPPAELQRDAMRYPIIPSAVTDLPDINASIEGVMQRVNALKIEELIAQATSMMASIDALARNDSTRAVPEAVVALLNDARTIIGSEALQRLPDDVAQTVARMNGIVEQIEQQRIVDQLGQAITDVSSAADTVYAATEDVPALVTDLRGIAAKVEALQAEELVAAATDLLQSADALIDSDAARNLPATVSASLEEIRTLLVQLREGGAVENANATLAAIRSAADSVDEASKGLPDLSRRLDSLAVRAEQLIGAYGDRSDFNQETLAMLREVRAAARNIATLVRSIERSPNSILFGK